MQEKGKEKCTMYDGKRCCRKASERGARKISKHVHLADATSCKFTTIEQKVSSVRRWYDMELEKYGHLANPLRDERQRVGELMTKEEEEKRKNNISKYFRGWQLPSVPR